MSAKGCELCSNPARMFCDSDQASLCWDCDEKVHAANFLVAKHSRTLLCHVCHSPTPWKAAGPKLGQTITVCHNCAHRGATQNDQNALRRTQNAETDDDREYYTTEYDEDDEIDDEVDEDLSGEDEDGENQVVPWSETNSPPTASSSSEEDDVSLSSSKRTRDSEDEDGCTSNEESDKNCCSSSLRLVRALKTRRGSGGGGGGALIGSDQGAEPSGTAAIVEKLRRFEKEIVREESGASAMICRALRSDQRLNN